MSYYVKTKLFEGVLENDNIYASLIKSSPLAESLLFNTMEDAKTYMKKRLNSSTNNQYETRRNKLIKKYFKSNDTAFILKKVSPNLDTTYNTILDYRDEKYNLYYDISPMNVKMLDLISISNIIKRSVKAKKDSLSIYINDMNTIKYIYMELHSKEPFKNLNARFKDIADIIVNYARERQLNMVYLEPKRHLSYIYMLEYLSKQTYNEIVTNKKLANLLLTIHKDVTKDHADILLSKFKTPDPLFINDAYNIVNTTPVYICSNLNISKQPVIKTESVANVINSKINKTTTQAQQPSLASTQTQHSDNLSEDTSQIVDEKQIEHIEPLPKYKSSHGSTTTEDHILEGQQPLSEAEAIPDIEAPIEETEQEQGEIKLNLDGIDNIF